MPPASKLRQLMAPAWCHSSTCDKIPTILADVIHYCFPEPYSVCLPNKHARWCRQQVLVPRSLVPAWLAVNSIVLKHLMWALSLVLLHRKNQRAVHRWHARGKSQHVLDGAKSAYTLHSMIEAPWTILPNFFAPVGPAVQVHHINQHVPNCMPWHAGWSGLLVSHAPPKITTDTSQAGTASH
jgi:hypothetical protein